MYESNNNPLAYNSRNQATGIAQIRPRACLRPTTNGLAKAYAIEDMYSVEISTRGVYVLCLPEEDPIMSR